MKTVTTIAVLCAAAFITCCPCKKCLQPEDCIPFEPLKARVEQADGSWKVVMGSMWMLDFGSNQDEAKQALKIIQHYKMNKQCFVGRPDASLKYWLVDNSAPSGMLAGEDCISFNPNTIEVKLIDGRWKIVDGSSWLIDFGDSQCEAQEAFKIIKCYGFTNICYVGRPDPSMIYLRK